MFFLSTHSEKKLLIKQRTSMEIGMGKIKFPYVHSYLQNKIISGKNKLSEMA